MQDLLTSPFVPLIFVLVVMYFLLMRPQQQRMKQLRQSIANMRRGDTVITAGGHIATVSKPVKPEDEHVTVEIADGVHTKVQEYHQRSAAEEPARQRQGIAVLQIATWVRVLIGIVLLIGFVIALPNAIPPNVLAKMPRW